MKALIIGGRDQNKLELAKNFFGFEVFFNGKTSDFSELSDSKIIYGLNHLIKRMIESGLDDQQIKETILKNDYDIVISDEIGCAVVEIEKTSRRIVELTGRITCLMAQNSENVIRFICGIPQIIKGDLNWK